MPSEPEVTDDFSPVDWLLLFPTKFERDEIQNVKEQPPSNALIEICGFGLAVSGARTSQLLYRHQPKRVMLIGIAGHYDAALESGQAIAFTDVACFGIGVGTGDRFVTAGEMGWKHWDDHERAIGDRIRLNDGLRPTMLLSVAAASENQQDVSLRKKLYPEAIAEDMEGFAVAAACRLAGIPLTIVRGISNRAGVRNKSEWRIRDAMQAAWEMGREMISKNSN